MTCRSGVIVGVSVRVSTDAGADAVSCQSRCQYRHLCWCRCRRPSRRVQTCSPVTWHSPATETEARAVGRAAAAPKKAVWLDRRRRRPAGATLAPLAAERRRGGGVTSRHHGDRRVRPADDGAPELPKGSRVPVTVNIQTDDCCSASIQMQVVWSLGLPGRNTSNLVYT